MPSSATRKQKILIADDSPINRALLMDMLEDEYELLEACDGEEAVAILQARSAEIDLVLLDIVMPKMDGFAVLETMKRHRWLESVAVIMISSDDSASHIERAFGLGVTDFISRPFDAVVVHHRIANTMLLYAKQKRLIGIVTDQLYDKQKQNSLMVDILSHIVEFRNGESGQHVLHIHTLTELLLTHLTRMTDRYPLSMSDISLISTASALHDIGKIAIPEEILNKPGRLTPQEMEIMKTHSMIGADMLKALPIHQSEPLVKTAYEICRWHHERYDGNGYPDGLKGDAIPISAQIVALADVYDALTSDRVYKKAYSHERSLEMILGGECGVFNPLLLDCLKEMADSIRTSLGKPDTSAADERKMLTAAEELMRAERITLSERTLRLLEDERQKFRFFSSLSKDLLFEYVRSPSMLTLNPYGSELLGLPQTLLNPLENNAVLSLIDKEAVRLLADALHATTPDQPLVQQDCLLHLPQGDTPVRMLCKASWSDDDPPRYLGAIGKSFILTDAGHSFESLEWVSTHDLLTKLYDLKTARKHITVRINNRRYGPYALVVLDLAHMRQANALHGHDFGDRVLVYLAEKLRQAVRDGDILARLDGDEFLIFLSHKGNAEIAVKRIYAELGGAYESFPVTVHMGVACGTGGIASFDTLLQKAMHAMQEAKLNGVPFRFAAPMEEEADP